MAESPKRGRLKIFLGYASGVGKSFRMFDEGRRRHERGEGVVVAAMQPDMDSEVDSIARSMDSIPTLNVYSGGQVVKTIVGAKPKSALLKDLEAFIA